MRIAICEDQHVQAEQTKQIILLLQKQTVEKQFQKWYYSNHGTY